MDYLLLIVLGFFVFGGTELSKKVLKKREIFWPLYKSESSQAEEFNISLTLKIAAMRAYPHTTDADWHELLPLCHFSDDWYARTHPGKDFLRMENAVRMHLAQ